MSGRGTVYTYTINRQAWVPGLEVPFVIAMVELDEQPGLRLMTNIVDCPTEEVEIGMPVEVAFVERGEAFVPVFHRSRHDRALRGPLHHLRHRPVRRRPAHDQGRDGADARRVLEAIADAGLKPADIDGVVSWPGAVTRNEASPRAAPAARDPARTR